MKYFNCRECLRIITDEEIAAYDKTSPFIKCCKCIMKQCCFHNCENKRFLNSLFCKNHQTMNCIHTNCMFAPVKNQKFCSEHQCNHLHKTKTCHYEKSPDTYFCEYHHQRYLKKKSKQEKADIA